jgi:multidrug efflux pump subunit AcrA (membrane-fusion protein)
MVGLLILFFVFMFLPWTQNIQSVGKVTTLLPQDRPQQIQSAISGRIEKWYVREGQFVSAGDTIVKLTEVKAEYLDPLLVDRTEAQRVAKAGSADSYLDKVAALDRQVASLRDQLILKQEQLDQKLRQVEFKVTTQEANIANAEAQLAVAVIQSDRADSLFTLGINPRSKLEEKLNKRNETSAKLTSELNKLAELRNELAIVKLERNNAGNATREKIAKSQSDQASALSGYYSATGDTEKLASMVANYTERRNFYYVLAPQDAIISETYVPGIGETVKEGGSLMTIVPANPKMAVELFVRPMDLPLIQRQQEVRLLFDGWPAIVFGGWPNMSFGTFTGDVVAIDNNTNKKGEYRILVAPSEGGWPEQLRPGSGANGIALLSDVPLWYEIWRQLNGFPADFYTNEDKKEEKVKTKAPVRSVIK